MFQEQRPSSGRLSWSLSESGPLALVWGWGSEFQLWIFIPPTSRECLLHLAWTLEVLLWTGSALEFSASLASSEEVAGGMSKLITRENKEGATMWSHEGRALAREVRRGDS